MVELLEARAGRGTGWSGELNGLSCACLSEHVDYSLFTFSCKHKPNPSVYSCVRCVGRQALRAVVGGKEWAL